MRTVVIVEPHPLFRLGLRQLLSDAFPHLCVRDYEFHCLTEPPASSPDEECKLLLLSVQDSAQAVQDSQRARERFQPASMLILADDEHLPTEVTTLPECVAGAVRRSSLPEVLKASVSLVLAGGTCFPARWSQHASNRPSLNAQPAPANGTSSRYEPTRWYPAAIATSASRSLPATDASGHNVPEGMDGEFKTPIRPGSAAHKECQLLGLTPRQYEVLVLLARGYPMKKVGRALNISVATAKAHTETLYQRLDVHNRNAAVYAAVTRGATLGWARPPGLAHVNAGSS